MPKENHRSALQAEWWDSYTNSQYQEHKTVQEREKPRSFIFLYAVFLRVFTHPPRFAEISFLVKIFIEKINDVVKNAFEELGYERETGRVNVSNRPDLCQYQCNGALANAKKHKKAPMIIAQEVVEKLNDNKMYFY